MSIKSRIADYEEYSMICQDLGRARVKFDDDWNTDFIVAKAKHFSRWVADRKTKAGPTRVVKTLRKMSEIMPK